MGQHHDENTPPWRLMVDSVHQPQNQLYLNEKCIIPLDALSPHDCNQKSYFEQGTTAKPLKTGC